MKKKPFDIDKNREDKLSKNNDQEGLQPFDERIEREMEASLKSAFHKGEKNLQLTESFKGSLVSRMKEASAQEKSNTSVQHTGDTTKGWEKLFSGVRDFLNREIEIPLVPVIAAAVLMIAVNIFPLNYEPRSEGRFIEVGGSQLWIAYEEEGGAVAYEN